MMARVSEGFKGLSTDKLGRRVIHKRPARTTVPAQRVLTSEDVTVCAMSTRRSPVMQTSPVSSETDTACGKNATDALAFASSAVPSVRSAFTCAQLSGATFPEFVT